MSKEYKDLKPIILFEHNYGCAKHRWLVKGPMMIGRKSFMTFICSFCDASCAVRLKAYYKLLKAPKPRRDNPLTRLWELLFGWPGMSR